MSRSYIYSMMKKRRNSSVLSNNNELKEEEHEKFIDYGSEENEVDPKKMI